MSSSFAAVDIEAMTDIRGAFNPDQLCNPHKIFPTDRGCVEVTRPRPRGGG